MYLADTTHLTIPGLLANVSSPVLQMLHTHTVKAMDTYVPLHDLGFFSRKGIPDVISPVKWDHHVPWI